MQWKAHDQNHEILLYTQKYHKKKLHYPLTQFSNVPWSISKHGTSIQQSLIRSKTGSPTEVTFSVDQYLKSSPIKEVAPYLHRALLKTAQMLQNWGLLLQALFIFNASRSTTVQCICIKENACKYIAHLSGWGTILFLPLSLPLFEW